MNRRLWLSALSLTLVAALVRSASAVSIYQVTDLGTLGGTASVARAINDRGQVVGESTINSGENHAFIWENGRMRDLGLFPGDLFAAASDINNRGQVVGAGAADFSPHALLWENGRVIDLGGTFSQAFAINNRGQIVGVTSGGAALWQNGVLHNLASLSGGGSEAFDINDKGVIVGYSTTATGESHAVMWTDGGIVDLGTLPGDDFSQALAINRARLWARAAISRRASNVRSSGKTARCVSSARCPPCPSRERSASMSARKPLVSAFWPA
jgi:probable HAF family extracellular repeat protein